ncbi:hypothetical protein ABEB36_014402 [Hypothenemus hampei]|uniref:Envelope protein n=1 Tax=Hypothenemus hampei TaxID=57062 RepID=A0ABD1E1Q4_HYPHA
MLELSSIPLICMILVLFRFSASVNIEISAGAFWKKLPDTITYEATIPLSYETDWVETLFPTPEEKEAPCYDTTGNCDTRYQFKALGKAFAEEIHLLDNIYHMSTIRINRTGRTKRALDFIGEGFSWCCGLATDQKLRLIEGDEASVRRRLDTLTDTVASSLHAMTQDTTQFRNYEEQVRSTFQETERRIRTMGIHLLKIQQKSEKSDQQLQAILHTVVHNELMAFKHSITIARLLRKQTILSSCQDHRLPSSIVDPTTLKADLLKLAAVLRESQQELAIPLADIFLYYKLPLTECSFTTAKMFLLLKVPILQAKKRWELFELVTVPFAWYNQTCSIPHRPLYLAANTLQTPFTTETRQITGTGLHQCKPYHDKLCYVSRFSPEALEGPECAKILFTGGTIQEISQHCPINCNPSTHMVIAEVLEDTYIVTHPTAPLSIVCGTNTTVLPAKYNRQGALKVQLACSCHLRAGTEVLIPARFPCRDTRNHAQYTHIIPGIWSNLKTFILDRHDQHRLPTYTNMDECLNANWSIEIPHLNITYQETTLKDLQGRLDQTRSAVQKDQTTGILVMFLFYWSILASLLITLVIYRQSRILLMLATTHSARAEDLGTGIDLNIVHMGILWLCSVLLAALLISCCLHGIGRRVLHWYKSRTHRRHQQSRVNIESIAVEQPAIHNENVGFIKESIQ